MFCCRLDKLFNGYQLLGSKSRTDKTVSEDQFNTLLARIGVQGLWLSKHDISQVLWLVKSWSLESEPLDGKSKPDDAAGGTVSALEFRRCLTMTVALNFSADDSGGSGGDPGGSSLATGFRALLKQLEVSALGQQLSFMALEPKEAHLAQATAAAAPSGKKPAESGGHPELSDPAPSPKVVVAAAAKAALQSPKAKTKAKPVAAVSRYVAVLTTLCQMWTPHSRLLILRDFGLDPGLTYLRTCAQGWF